MFGFAQALPWTLRKFAGQIAELIKNLQEEDGTTILAEDGTDIEEEG